VLKKLRCHADLVLTLGLTGIGFALYIATVAPSVLMADAGEFQFVPYIAGITHPTGYPLYTILGWLWTHCIPCRDVAYRMNIFSALWGAVTVGLIYQVANWSLKLGAPAIPSRWRRMISALAASLVMTSATFWSQAVIAEVYTMNSAFVASILYISLRLWNTSVAMGNCTSSDQQCVQTTARRLVALSLACGLSLTHHRTMLLLLPWVGLFAWSLIRRTNYLQRWRWRHILVGLLVPQLLYLYIPWRAPHVPYLELPLDSARTLVLYEKSLRGVLDLVLGGAFGGRLAEGPIGLARLDMAVTLLRDQFTWVGVFLGIIGLAAIIRKRAWPLLALTLFPYVSYVAFNLLYFIGDVYVLFIPSYLIWALWAGWGAGEAGSALARAAGGKLSPLWRERLTGGFILLSFCLPIFLLVRNYPLVNQSQNWSAVSFWQPILKADLPQGAVLVSNDRDEIMPLWYYQYVDGQRPDLLGLFPLIVRQPGYANVVEVTDSALASQRPTFLIKPMPGLELKYELRAQEPLVQVLASHAGRHPSQPLDLSFGGVVALVGYDASQESADTLRVTLFWKPVQKMDRRYSSFVHLQDATGRSIAGHDHQPGGDYYPTDAWKPDEVLLDTHIVSLPEDMAAGEYRLTAGLYVWPSMERLGAELEIGTVRIGTS